MRRLSGVTTLTSLAWLALVLLTGGCASWNRLSVPQPAALPDTLPRNQFVQVWTPRGSHTPALWFAVVISRDSVSGIPSDGRREYSRQPCCRMSVTRADVDSIRVGSNNAFTYFSLGALIAVIFLVAVTHT